MSSPTSNAPEHSEPRPWPVILGEIQTREDLLTKQGQELLGISPDELPIEVMHWRAAFSLMLALGNGWTDVTSQYLDDLQAGVAGFGECGFEIGVRGGQAAMQILDSYFRDWRAPGFFISFTDDPLEVSGSVLSEDAYNIMHDDFRRLDKQLMSETWAEFGDLEERLIARAHDLAASAM